MDFDGYGTCWDCGHPFEKHNEIKIGIAFYGSIHAFHRKCAKDKNKRKKWKRVFVFVNACTIFHLRRMYFTPLLSKQGSKLDIQVFADVYSDPDL